MSESVHSLVRPLVALAARVAESEAPPPQRFDVEIEAVLLERLSEGTLELRPPWELDGVLETLCLLVRGATAPRTASGPDPGVALLTFLSAVTEPATAPSAGTLPDANGLVEWLGALRREAESDEPLSPEGLRTRSNLMMIAPMSAVALWTARKHVRPLLDDPRLQATPEGRRLWLAGAQIFAASDGDRALADAAVDVMLNDHDVTDHSDPIGPTRGISLLIRLERFEEADTMLWRCRDAAYANPFTASLHAGQQAFLHWQTGELELAVQAGAHAGQGEGMGRVGGAAIGARALIELGRLDEARAVLDALPPPATPTDVGAALQLPALAELALAEGRVVAALGHMLANHDAIRLTGHRNPSGWRWLDPLTRALVASGQHERARSIVARASEDAERWNTPLVLAEAAEARSIAGMDTLEDPAEGFALRVQAPVESVASVAARAGLTPRVASVVELVADGMRDREIAEHLALSPRTVNRHVSTALRALGLRNRTELAAAVRGGQATDA